jgi:hypothetical protein
MHERYTSGILFIMLDWIGTLRVRARSPQRVELCLTRSTAVAGWVVLAAAAALAALVVRWDLPRAAWLVPGLVSLLGAVLATVRRELIFDREDGVLRIEQRLCGIASRAVVPLFHLRAVVIAARIGARIGPRFIAYVDRRIGNPVHLDESQRCASLLGIAEAIAEVADLRLVYDATTRAATR